MKEDTNHESVAGGGQMERDRALNPAEKSWHVLTKTRNGTVSLIRNLSLVEAVKVYEAVDPFRGKVSGVMYHCSDSDIEQREILGPDGWDGKISVVTQWEGVS